MTKTFIGFRIDNDIMAKIDHYAERNSINRTAAVKQLLLNGLSAIDTTKTLRDIYKNETKLDKKLNILVGILQLMVQIIDPKIIPILEKAIKDNTFAFEGHTWQDVVNFILAKD